MWPPAAARRRCQSVLSDVVTASTCFPARLLLAHHQWPHLWRHGGAWKPSAGHFGRGRQWLQCWVHGLALDGRPARCSSSWKSVNCASPGVAGLQPSAPPFQLVGKTAVLQAMGPWPLSRPWPLSQKWIECMEECAPSLCMCCRMCHWCADDAQIIGFQEEVCLAEQLFMPALEDRPQEEHVNKREKLLLCSGTRDRTEVLNQFEQGALI